MTKEEMDDHEYERIQVEDMIPTEETIPTTSSWSNENDKIKMSSLIQRKLSYSYLNFENYKSF